MISYLGIILGIVLTTTINIPYWLMLIFFLIFSIIRFIFHSIHLRNFSLAASLFFLSLAYASYYRQHLNNALILNPIYHLNAVVVIKSIPIIHDNFQTVDGEIVSGLLMGTTLALNFPLNHKIISGYRYKFNLNIYPLLLNNSSGTQFDYENYLYAEHISAHGQLNFSYDNGVQNFTLNDWISNLRQKIVDHLSQVLKNTPYMGLYIALATGYQNLIPNSQWELYKNLGIIHIVSISGLHITIIAFFINLICTLLLKFYQPQRVPKTIIVLMISTVITTIYCLFTGFSIATQRTFYMLLILAITQILRERISILQTLLLAAATLLIVDPLAYLTPGFWLSFGMVAIIILVIKLPNKISQFSSNFTTKISHSLNLWLKIQLFLGLISLPSLIYLFNSYALVAPLANLWAIPVLGNIFTPLILLTTIINNDWLLQIVNRLLNYALRPIEILAPFVPAFHQVSPPLILVILSTTGALLWLLPYSLPYKNLYGAVLFSSILLLTELPNNYFSTRISLFATSQVAIINYGQRTFLLLNQTPEQKFPQNFFNLTLLAYLKLHKINQLAAILFKIEQQQLINFANLHHLTITQFYYLEQDFNLNLGGIELINHKNNYLELNNLNFKYAKDEINKFDDGALLVYHCNNNNYKKMSNIVLFACLIPNLVDYSKIYLLTAAKDHYKIIKYFDNLFFTESQLIDLYTSKTAYVNF